MGATLGGSWYKPPQTVSDATVTVILKAKKTPVHYGVASVPYTRGIAATWQSELQHASSGNVQARHSGSLQFGNR